MRLHSDKGFTLVELMVVVLIIGVLVAIAIPVYQFATERAGRETCFGNQRTVAGAVQQWAVDNNADVSGAAGVIDGSHPLVGDHIFNTPPRCPVAPAPADLATIDVAHGAYTVDTSGSVLPCTHGDPAHGYFTD